MITQQNGGILSDTYGLPFVDIANKGIMTFHVLSGTI